MEHTDLVSYIFELSPNWSRHDHTNSLGIIWCWRWYKLDIGFAYLNSEKLFTEVEKPLPPCIVNMLFVFIVHPHS
jgi:hypothetical protein